jgi:hypothetical protein
MNGAALDFEQVDAEAAERFEGGKESAGPMSQAKCKRHFQHRRRSRLFHLTHTKLYHDLSYPRRSNAR